jgi:hypothetical protein
MKLYENFLNKTFSDNFLNTVQNIDSNISIEIFDTQNNKFRYNRIDIVDSDFVSYHILNSDKVQYAKISKIINKLYPNMFSNKEIESFVNQYKAEIRNDLIFKIVDGYDIKKYYSVDFTSEDGTIGMSCMRHNRCNDYFDIYCENPGKIKLLILFKKSDNTIKLPQKNKIIGRALLWKSVNLKIILMDKIYTSNYLYNYSFRKYAKDNNIVIIDNDIKTYTILNPNKYKYYPFVDTMFLYQPETGIITNKIKFTDSNYKTYILDDIYGSYRLYGDNILS